MGEALRIAMVGEATREINAKAKAPISYRQQHEAAAGVDACAIECACDLLAGDRWRQERGELWSVVRGVYGEGKWRKQ
jgi:hypothetical protein